jgi:HlyD family secretion protein
MRAFLPVALVLALAACGDKASKTMQGYAEADYIYLAPREAGVIKTLTVKEGDPVEAGALIFRLDQGRSNATLQRAQSTRTASGDTAAAQKQAVAEARASVNLASKTFARTQSLFKSGYASKAQLDIERANLDATNARLRTTLAEQKAAQSQTGAASADVKFAREQADDRSAVAPVAGRIERIFLRPGEFAGAGAPVVSLLAPPNMKLRFYAPEPALAQMRLGGVVDVACDGCAAGLSARISYIASQPEFTPPIIYSKQERAKLVYLVEARPEQPEKVRPGQPVDVSLRADAKSADKK